MRFLFIQNTEAFQAMRTAASLLSAPAAAGQPLAIHFVGRQGRAAATAAQNAAGEKLKPASQEQSGGAELEKGPSPRGAWLARRREVPRLIGPRRAGRQALRRPRLLQMAGGGYEATSSKGRCKSTSGPGGEHGRTGHFKAGLSFLFPGLPLFPHCFICEVDEV